MLKFWSNVLKYPIYLAGMILVLINTNLALFWYYFVIYGICTMLGMHFGNSIKAFARTAQFRVVPEKRITPLSAPSVVTAALLLGCGIVMNAYCEDVYVQTVVLAFFIAINVFVTVVDAIRYLYIKDSTWLVEPGGGPNPSGDIGIPNTISVIRISIAVALPPMFAWMRFPAGKIACFIILVAIMATDCLDGILARQLNAVTKAGKYLDPLGDKALFIPNGVAILLILAVRGPANSHLLTVTSISVAISVARDILILCWYGLKSKNYPKGVAAGMVDKIRVNVCDAWLIVVANMVTIGFLPEVSEIVSLCLAILAAVLSFISIFVDTERLKIENSSL